MAKVTAPLFSFGASGQLAKALVYFPYKGLSVVRSHVVPANPNTAAQQTQRSFMTNAVDEWHAAGYTDPDHGAFNRWASTLGKGLSGFNAFCRAYIDERVAGGTWRRIAAAVVSLITGTTFRVQVTKASGGDVPSIFYGVSPTFMPNAAVMVDQTGNVWRVDLAALTPGTVYYWYLTVGTPGSDLGRTGVYLTRTA